MLFEILTLIFIKKIHKKNLEQNFKIPRYPIVDPH